jgi:thymidylate synthase ThyX
MPPKRQVYLLDPQTLSPETIAVTFAKTSRSPETFREIANGLTNAKTTQFHEKWVVGYGHSSVAEHAVLHIACENISRLAVETLQSNRLASYTEKSTRYQKWDANSYIVPPELESHLLTAKYLDTCQNLFETYHQILPAVQNAVCQQFPRQDDETEAAWERRIRSEYADVCRFILPAASLANVGMTINARALEYALCKMLTHPLQEVRLLGGEIKRVAQAEVPTLVKYANRSEYLEQTRQELTQAAFGMKATGRSDEWCCLLHFDPQAEDRVLAASLYRYSNIGYAQSLDHVRSLPPEQRLSLAQSLFHNLAAHDVPLRELEHSSLTFEVTLDQGAYYELKRHRMLTLTPQPLTATLGYATPLLLQTAGVTDLYHKAMDSAHQTYTQIASWNPEVAAYIVPNGFNRRALLTLNLRSADHFLQLRSAPNAHFSIRRLAQHMAEQIRQIYPLLGGLMRVEPGETWQGIEARYFASLF